MERKDILRTLFDCRNQWQLLAITGSDDKRSYIPARFWKNACVCCELVHPNQYEDNTCKKCPLIGFAFPVYNSILEEGDTYFMDQSFNCEFEESVYAFWMECTTSTDRKYYALEIVKGCNRAIEHYLLMD